MNDLPRITSEQAKIIGKMGEIKSGESRRKKKSLLEISEYLLSQKVNSKFLNEQTIKLIDKKMTYAEAMVLSQIVKAINGDAHAASYIRDISGQKELEKSDVNRCDFEAWLVRYKYLLQKIEW